MLIAWTVCGTITHGCCGTLTNSTFVYFGDFFSKKYVNPVDFKVDLYF